MKDVTGLGDLFTKTGSGTGFSARNLDSLLDRLFNGRMGDSQAEQTLFNWV